MSDSTLSSCRIALGVLLLAVGGCGGESPNAPPPPSGSGGSGGAIASNASLFTLITEREPFSMYQPFPRVDVLRSGTSAHQPVVRVSMNATAFATLQNGTLPRGTKFPNGSIIFKEILPSMGGSPSQYAVMYKDAANALAGNGWLWAEFRPSGSVDYSVTNRGGACTSCHALADGPSNDFVRTFERQR